MISMNSMLSWPVETSPENQNQADTVAEIQTDAFVFHVKGLAFAAAMGWLLMMKQLMIWSRSRIFHCDEISLVDFETTLERETLLSQLFVQVLPEQMHLMKLN